MQELMILGYPSHFFEGKEILRANYFIPLQRVAR